jgi:hypothetical protein
MWSKVLGALRWSWRELGSAIEWSSNGDRRRPDISERGDAYDDPTAGWGRPDAASQQERHRTED